jgi:hypothetical protein
LWNSASEHGKKYWCFCLLHSISRIWWMMSNCRVNACVWRPVGFVYIWF